MGKSEKTEAFFNKLAKKIETGRLSEGEAEAYWAWCSSRNREEIVEDGHLWGRCVHDFIQTMRKAGVESFITTDQSTGLMGNLHGFVAEGCTIDSLCIVKSDYKYDSDKQGIRIKL